MRRGWEGSHFQAVFSRQVLQEQQCSTASPPWPGHCHTNTFPPSHTEPVGLVLSLLPLAMSSGSPLSPGCVPGTYPAGPTRNQESAVSSGCSALASDHPQRPSPKGSFSLLLFALSRWNHCGRGLS